VPHVRATASTCSTTKTRGQLSYRRVCALVQHLPNDATVWRSVAPDKAYTRTELLTATVEQRITIQWATFAALLRPGDHRLGADLAA
jgi:hypothetical protein